MISASAKALAEQLTLSEVDRGLLYPEIPRLRKVTQAVAIAVAQQAISEGNAQLTGDVETAVKEAMWDPVYPDYTT
jgi:malic enzyme